MGSKNSRTRTIEGRQKCNYPYLHWKRRRNNEVWCKCDNYRLTKGWTSGHRGIDNFIKETQLKAKDRLDPYLEWVPYDRLVNIKKIGEGGFSVVYSADWIDMDKRVSWGSMIKGRPVALKSINESNEMSAEYINELKIHYRCISAIPPLDGEARYDHGFLRFFGITQNPETKDYIMITELAPYKDIRNLLRQNFTDLSWCDKLYWLRNIAGNLVTIHNADYTHRNLHPGNILMGQIKDDLTVAKLAHLGLSRPAKKLSSIPFKEFYGVLPYVAPEIILGRKYTKASDIYSIGIIMAEISTSIPPFIDRAHDNKLALDICNGLRPNFAEGTPKSYIDFAGQCTNSNPSERPNAEKLLYMFDHWWKITQDPEILDDTFNAADKVIPNIDTSFTAHPDACYKSRLLNFEGVFDES